MERQNGGRHRRTSKKSLSARIEEARKSKATKLDLSGERLSQLPEALGQLIQLQELALFDNQLTAVSEVLGGLTQLQKLSLAGNQLTAVSEVLVQLTRLQVLNLASNRLTAIPEALRHLTSLQEFYLHGNTALGLPLEVLGPTIRDVVDKQAQPTKPGDILEYYFRVRGDRRPLNEAKLILEGRSAVGKTSIVQQFVDGRFDPNEKKTEGIQITEWLLRLHGHEDVQLHVWDFGGQEIMHATHQFFLTQRSLYLLVLNDREGGEDANADYWLKLITSFGGDSPVIVMLNKIKEHPFDLNRRALQQKYPFIRDFVKTDCADGTGIIALREAIERETDRLEHLRDAFPASWFTIKDQLTKMKKNSLSFDEYCAICAERGEVDTKAQEDLAGYLHTLGIVLNYKDAPRLQDTHVLNPHWVTNGIYKILNADKLEPQQGEIRLRELSEILDAREYPGHMRRFILDLMKQFELCFSFPDNETRYLIPELLDKQEPLEAAAFTPETCLHFQYHYPLERADIILLLVSADFIASDYCYEKELTSALERHEKGAARVIPIIVRDVHWRIAHLPNSKPCLKTGGPLPGGETGTRPGGMYRRGLSKLLKRCVKCSGHASDSRSAITYHWEEGYAAKYRPDSHHPRGQPGTSAWARGAHAGKRKRPTL
jgi:internalin A